MKKFALKFTSSAFWRWLQWGPRQRPLARWFYPQLWLVHLKFERALKFNSCLRSHSNSNGPVRVEDKTTLRAAVVADPITNISGKPERQILSQILRSSWVFRPPKYTYLEWNFLGFMELLVLLRFRTFPFEEKAIILWSDIWPVKDGVVCLSILLEGGVTVSNNFTKRRQNGSRDKFATHLR